VALPDIVIALTTVGENIDAGWLADRLVEERLAACVNVLPPMQSTYRWNEGVTHDTERQILIKTTADRVASLHARIRELHSYEVPEFIVLPVLHGDDRFLGWIRRSVASSAGA
jgi:periplasmic divalent cation tolerance protein